MSLPISYSATTEGNNFDGFGSAYRYVYRSKQAKPYDLPAAYVIRRGYTIAATRSAPFSQFSSLANVWASKGISGWGPDVGETFGYVMDRAVNNLYDKFRDTIQGATAMAAVNVAERNQALSMIESRAKQLLRFCNALRKRDLHRAAGLLGLLKEPRGVRGRAKDFAGLFLEFHFGWEPLIADIHASVDILQGSIPDKYITCRGKREVSRHYSRVDTGQRIETLDVVATSQASASCRVEVVNPSLHEADQLGLVNPISVAWELVPFSFVVDWFVPVSSFLNSMTDFLGLNLDRASYFTVLRTPSWLNDVTYYVAPFGHRHIVTTGFYGLRRLGIPSVTLVPRRVYGVSPTRAATAISLLLQQGLRGV